MAIASWVATSWATPSCSGENGPVSTPRLRPPISSPPTIIGTTRYVSIPDASSASPSALLGNDRTQSG